MAEPEDWENLYKLGKAAAQGAVWKLAKEAVEWLDEWQRPKQSRIRSSLLTDEEYEAMLERQGGVCAICKEKPKKGRLQVDHAHGTDKVRGLLCSLCNPALGLFKDDPNRLAEATECLKRAHSGLA